MPSYPRTRLRRLRYLPQVRRMLTVGDVRASQLLLPLFVCEGEKVRRPIGSMPGHHQLSVDLLDEELDEAESLGLAGVLLFGIPAVKDALGKDSYSQQGILQRAIERCKRRERELLIVSDVCFCEYTDHGHCGVITDGLKGPDVDNDRTLSLLRKQVVSHAHAGVDMVAPSGMMDGMVLHIRDALDEHEFQQLPIMSYAVKYASSFYGPFREAAESTPQFGDRRSYQMDFRHAGEQAIREAALDLEEGADMLMVKPAMAYLDVIRLLSEEFPGVPLAAYNVSGEYSMVKAAAEKGWIDERAIVMEQLLAMCRAGAQILITYWSKDVARWLRA